VYEDEYLEKSGPDNRCCHGNMSEFKGADPDEAVSENYLQKQKENPPEAPEEFRGVEDRSNP
jgi:hypothetical protein